jgi:rhodanese-related sulfurtransferase
VSQLQYAAVGYRSLSPDEVAELLKSDEVFVVDVREPRQYHGGHLPDAILLPAGDFADRYRREIDPQDTVILVCERGQTSEAAARFLLSQGFTDVATMAGGMNAWKGPLEKK